MTYLTTLALDIGFAAGGRMRHLRSHRLRAWLLVVIGFGRQVASANLRLGPMATPMAVAGAVSLLAFAGLNPQLVGMGVVAVGGAASALVIEVDKPMSMRPAAAVAAHVPTRSDEPAITYRDRHHRPGAADHLVALADIIPIPALRQVVSFGDLIGVVGAVATVAHVLRAGPGHAAAPR